MGDGVRSVLAGVDVDESGAGDRVTHGPASQTMRTLYTFPIKPQAAWLLG